MRNVGVGVWINAGGIPHFGSSHTNGPEYDKLPAMIGRKPQRACIMRVVLTAQLAVPETQ